MYSQKISTVKGKNSTDASPPSPRFSISDQMFPLPLQIFCCNQNLLKIYFFLIPFQCFLSCKRFSPDSDLICFLSQKYLSAFWFDLFFQHFSHRQHNRGKVAGRIFGEKNKDKKNMNISIQRQRKVTDALFFSQPSYYFPIIGHTI